MTICNPADKCTGCALCLNSCPKNAISFKCNKEGFYYPSINDELCINCHKCQNECPQNQREQNINEQIQPLFYYANAVDAKTRKSGSSGGLFGAIAKKLLDEGYVIYGACFDKNFNLTHVRVSEKSELDKLYCSKYIQSDISNIYKLISKDISAGIRVLFVGTPCQVDAIKRFIGTSELLVTIDLVCYGVGSNLIFNDFLHSKEREFNSKAVDVVFRKKIYGNHNGFTTIAFENCKQYKRIFYQTEFGIAFCNHLISRLSCYQCKYSSFVRCGDLTIGDYRSSNKKISPFKLKKGVSLIRINTLAGQQLINCLTSCNLVKTEKIEYEHIKDNLIRQSPMVIPSEKRNEAMNVYTNYGYDLFSRKFCASNKKVYREMKISFLKEVIKWIIGK